MSLLKIFSCAVFLLSSTHSIFAMDHHEKEIPNLSASPRGERQAVEVQVVEQPNALQNFFYDPDTTPADEEENGIEQADWGYGIPNLGWL